MTLEELEQILEQLSESTGIDQEDLIQTLADYAQLKYGNNLTAAERGIINNLKEKLLIGYYDMPNHSYVARRPNYKEKFELDDLEMSLLESAFNELGQEGLIHGNENYTQLTDNGILRAREIRGTI